MKVDSRREKWGALFSGRPLDLPSTSGFLSVCHIERLHGRGTLFLPKRFWLCQTASPIDRRPQRMNAFFPSTRHLSANYTAPSASRARSFHPEDGFCSRPKRKSSAWSAEPFVHFFNSCPVAPKVFTPTHRRLLEPFLFPHVPWRALAIPSQRKWRHRRSWHRQRGRPR